MTPRSRESTRKHFCTYLSRARTGHKILINLVILSGSKVRPSKKNARKNNLLNSLAYSLLDLGGNISCSNTRYKKEGDRKLFEREYYVSTSISRHVIQIITS